MTHSAAIAARTLLAAAIDSVRSSIEQFGNEISPTHAQALEDLLRGLVGQAFGLAPGRMAYGMPCGAGKTQAVVALLAAANRLGCGLSFAVAANSIRALCMLKRDLMAAGVPESVIGLRYGSGKTLEELTRECADEPTPVPPAALLNTGDDDRLFMLVSHSSIKKGDAGSKFLNHRGRPRDLLIWDETLFTADAGTLPLGLLRKALRYLGDDLPRTPVLSAFLSVATSKIEQEIGAQERGAAPTLLDLGAGSDINAAALELRSLIAGGDEAQEINVGRVRLLLRLAERSCAVALVGGANDEKAVIHFTVDVDPRLSNIAILDASHSVRHLARAGDILDCTTEAMRYCKTYDQVEVKQLRVAAGKSTQVSPKREASEAAKHAVKIVQSLPRDERVLIFTFKATVALMRRLFREEGIDLAATTDGRRRVSILTWGQETSTNAYGDCAHVLLVGVLRRRRTELAATLAGEANDLLIRHNAAQLDDIVRSEMAHCVLQAMHRGNCRRAHGGKAGAMTLHIIDAEVRLRDILAPSLPGVAWTTASPGRASSLTRQVREAVVAIVAQLSAGVPSISVTELKRAVAAAFQINASESAWTKAIKLAATDLYCLGLGHPVAGRWVLAGRSLVRC